MTDRNELRKLAEEANERGGWYPAGVMWDVLIEGLQSQTAKEDAAYIAAASPDVVLGLLDEIEREKSGWFQRYVDADCARKDAEIERDELRAVLGKIAEIDPAVTHGWAECVREMARNALKAR